MEFSAEAIAALVNGTVEGNKNALVNALAKIEEAKSGSLSFLANPKYTDYIYSTGASIVIVSNDFVAEKELPSTCTLVRTADPYAGFSALLAAYEKMMDSESGISSQANIAEGVKIGENCFIDAFVNIESGTVIGDNVRIKSGCRIGKNVRIGSGTILNQNVVAYHNGIIGNHCMIHAGVILGSDGFGFAPNADNDYKKVPQIGNVILEDHVEVGSNSTIDRATLGSTIIRKGVKLDNLIQVAHNVEIGKNTVIAAQTGIAGSTKIGENCMIGGQVGISGHLKIADGVKIAAQSGIGNSIKKENSIVQGSPAFSIGDYKRAYVHFKNLPKMAAEFGELKNSLTTNQNINS
jgi:UDP-3-O-[3-hydroxymyristoyl] glucosamine N-acyltransferase